MGSEMCIRDRCKSCPVLCPVPIMLRTYSRAGAARAPIRGGREGFRRRIYTMKREGRAKIDSFSVTPARPALGFQPDTTTTPKAGCHTRAPWPPRNIPQITKEEVCYSTRRGWDNLTECRKFYWYFFSRHNSSSVEGSLRVRTSYYLKNTIL